MVINWVLSLVDAFLFSLVIKEPKKDETEVEEQESIDYETGLKLPVLNYKEEYFDPVTGVRVESYYEDLNDESGRDD